MSFSHNLTALRIIAVRRNLACDDDSVERKFYDHGPPMREPGKFFARFAARLPGKVRSMATKRTLMGAGDRMIAVMLPFLLAAIVTWSLGVDATVIALPRAATIVGAILTGFGIVGYLWSAVDIVRSFRVEQLVTTGAFGLCRHPLYAAWILALLPGLALLSGNLLFVLADLALIVGYLRFIGHEEQQLVDEFGEAYRSYARRHFGLLPLGPIRNVIRHCRVLPRNLSLHAPDDERTA